MLYAKLFVVLICTVFTISQKYSSSFDNTDIYKILSNDRILTNYIKCVLNERPCTPEGRELKERIPEALRTNCAKCTEAQKQMVRKAANFIAKNKPDQWKLIQQHFDPSNKYTETFNKFLKEN